MKVILAIFFVALIAAFYIWNRRPIERTPEEIAALLRARLRGEEDQGEWDYFTKCRVRDMRLEAIRAKVLEIEVLGSPYLKQDGEDPFQLSDLGAKRFEELMSECKQISQTS